MKILKSGRQTGRTHYHVAGLKSDPNVWLLVHSESEKQRIVQEYFPGDPLVDKWIIDRIVTPSAFLGGRLRGVLRRESVINIDNLDLVLPQLLGVNRVGIVTTTEG